MMQRFLTVIFILLLMHIMPLIANAQDVIVKKDGTTILSKVLEVNKNEIKYKKHSNRQGPLYVIEKADVMAINYESGDKDVFADTAKSATPEKVTSSSGVNPDLAEKNLQIVREYNNRKVEYVGPNGDKACGGYGIILRMEEGSILETSELKADFKTKYGETLQVSLYNKTNQIIYIDLANCYFIECDNARPLYVPSSTSTGKSSTTGGSVNLGAIAGAAGIGGAIGTLAGGVNVGGANTNSNTTTVYSQRVVSIPPMASISLNEIELYTFIHKSHNRSQLYSNVFLKYAPFFVSLGILKEKADSYIVDYGEMRRGQIIDIPRISGNELAIHIAYSFDENFTNSQSMRTNFYFSQVVAWPGGTEEVYANSTGSLKKYLNVKIPLIYTNQLKGAYYKIMKR